MSFTSAVSRRAGLLLLPALALAAACSEGAAPTAIAPDGPSMSHFDNIPPSSITVCVDGNSPAGTYNFSVASSEANPSLAPSMINGNGQFSLTPGGACNTVVWTSGPHSTDVADNEEWVTIQQTSQPAGTLFSKGAGVGSTAPLPNVEIDDAGKTVSIKANYYHGGHATFFSRVGHGIQGCTPGFWKNTKLAWPIAKNTSFNKYFDIETKWFPDALTLEQAVGLNGGGMNALARHATAGALNAAVAGVDYPYNVAQVKAYVQAAYNGSASIEGNKNILEAGNELGCPLSNGGK